MIFSLPLPEKVLMWMVDENLWLDEYEGGKANRSSNLRPSYGHG
jgi:hypothetical protein